MCTTNDGTPETRYSNPFTMEVTELECMDYISTTAISGGPFIYDAPATPATSDTEIISSGSSYATSSLLSDCPLTFTLYKVNPDSTLTAFTGTGITLDSTGKLTVDTNEI
jgi:hypothetical protein